MPTLYLLAAFFICWAVERLGVLWWSLRTLNRRREKMEEAAGFLQLVSRRRAAKPKEPSPVLDGDLEPGDELESVNGREEPIRLESRRRGDAWVVSRPSGRRVVMEEASIRRRFKRKA